MQQNKKKLYVEPRVKSVGFQVEHGFEGSLDYNVPTDCNAIVSNAALEGYTHTDTNEHFTYGWGE